MKAWRRARIVVITLIVWIVVSTAGCWSRNEIEDIGFVLSVGVDHAAKEGEIMITVHMAKPFAISPGISGGVEEKPFWQTSSTGHTVFEAIRNLRQQSPRRPLLSHSRFIVFGEEFARGGIGDVIDFFSREGEVRETSVVVVAKGVKASEVVWNEFELERMPSEGALGIMRIATRELSTTVMITLNDFLQMMETEGSEPVASRAELVRRPPSEDPRGELKRETISVSGRETGAAAFKGDKLVGWLDKTQTRGLQWVKGKVRSGIIVIEQPEKKDRLVSIEILRASATVTPKVVQGRPSILIKVGALGNLGEVQEFFDPMESQKVWTSMEQRMAEVIREEIKAALDIAKHDFNSDIFGFGCAICRKYPKEWADLKDKWDEEFPKLNVDIEVKASLRRSGLARRSIRIVSAGEDKER